jgi:hypothetical protein
MENTIRKHMEKNQDDSVTSAMGFIDFKLHIELENDTFDKHTLDEHDNLVKLGNQLVNRVQAARLCHARLDQLNIGLDMAKEDLEMAFKHYKEVRKSKEDEEETFEEVYRIYVN